jgi:hypothetical protein
VVETATTTTGERMDDEQRSEQVRTALFKALGVFVAIAVVIALGTVFMVHALGLNQSDDDGPLGASATGSPSPLPTKALPVPSQSASPSDQPSGDATPAEGGDGDIELEVSPVIASPMERINLTGTYKGADNQVLQIQRYTDGTWTNFDAKTTVRVGTFATYIMTGRAGENRIRVFDPKANKGSNVILVTIQ